MAKIIDITEKLDFESNPKIKIKDKEYEVNADAETALKVMGMFGENGEMSPTAVVKMYELIFNEKDRKEIAKLKLNFKSFQKLVETAIELVTGTEEDSGE